jgi:hypothetical protein
MATFFVIFFIDQLDTAFVATTANVDILHDKGRYCVAFNSLIIGANQQSSPKKSGPEKKLVQAQLHASI